jgi:hypothetical protein
LLVAVVPPVPLVVSEPIAAEFPPTLEVPTGPMLPPDPSTLVDVVKPPAPRGTVEGSLPLQPSRPAALVTKANSGFRP